MIYGDLESILISKDNGKQKYRINLYKQIQKARSLQLWL